MMNKRKLLVQLAITVVVLFPIPLFLAVVAAVLEDYFYYPDSLLLLAESCSISYGLLFLLLIFIRGKHLNPTYPKSLLLVASFVNRIFFGIMDSILPNFFGQGP